MNKPLVSILSITYNHSKYVAQALDSFVMQKTGFDFEVIIADDASTDNNQVVIKTYAYKYPDIIKPILRDKNIGMNPNFLDALSKCQGKYIAMCEGDDYWTDPYKLQKQVDFLEANPDYGLIHTDYLAFNENKKKIDEKYRSKNRERVKNGKIFFELLKGNFIGTPTVCVRAKLMKEFVEVIKNRKLWYVYDYWFWLKISLKTKIFYLNEKTVNYRVHTDSTSRGKNFFKIKKPLLINNILFEALKHKYINKSEFWKAYIVLIYALIRSNNIEALLYLFRIKKLTN